MIYRISSSWLLLLLFGIASARADIIVDFEDLALAPNSFFDGYGFAASSGSFSSQGTEFNTNQFGPGWSYSNQTDNTTAGFTNQWSAVTGSGFGGSENYALGTTFDDHGAFLNLPSNSTAQSLRITNATYTALSMLDGDAFAKKFGGVTGDDPDYFKITFTGFSSFNAVGGITGFVEFYLADYRFADNSQDFVVDDWQFLNLTSLGNARSIGIAFEGTDVGIFGLNTPAYVAIDQLQLSTSAVPEPSLIVPLFALGMTWWIRRKPILAAGAIQS